ncbi:hypothetical protein GW17_00052119 [Ensete ventricosum]|nr:hypothetical protein GW17_00052119 [Ensete ventricosum]
MNFMFPNRGNILLMPSLTVSGYRSMPSSQDFVKDRSVTHPANQPTPPAEGSSSKAVKTRPTVASEKHPIEGGNEPPKKRKEMAQKLGKGASSQDEEEVPKEGMRTRVVSQP